MLERHPYAPAILAVGVNLLGDGAASLGWTFWVRTFMLLTLVLLVGVVGCLIVLVRHFPRLREPAHRGPWIASFGALVFVVCYCAFVPHVVVTP